jgi:hypothetical protein
MQTIKQILIIILASVIVMALFMPLAQTEWAEGMRSGFGAEGMEGEGRSGPEGMGEIPAAVGFIAGFIKEIIIMGIPALLTLGVLKLVRGRSNSKKVQAAQ